MFSKITQIIQHTKQTMYQSKIETMRIWMIWNKIMTKLIHTNLFKIYPTIMQRKDKLDKLLLQFILISLIYLSVNLVRDYRRRRIVIRDWWSYRQKGVRLINLRWRSMMKMMWIFLSIKRIIILKLIPLLRVPFLLRLLIKFMICICRVGQWEILVGGLGFCQLELSFIFGPEQELMMNLSLN